LHGAFGIGPFLLAVKDDLELAPGDGDDRIDTRRAHHAQRFDVGLMASDPLSLGLSISLIPEQVVPALAAEPAPIL
jgi:hypothetical protein